MTDKTDPRLDAAMRASARWHRNEDTVDSDDHSLSWFILDAIDAADRAAGIVRVDTNDEALIEQLAEAERESRASYWDATTPAERAATGADGVSRHVARAILAALREAS